jgi:hypothetical protein
LLLRVANELIFDERQEEEASEQEDGKKRRQKKEREREPEVVGKPARRSLR